MASVLTAGPFIRPGINLHRGIAEQAKALTAIVNLKHLDVRDRWHTLAGRTIRDQWQASGYQRSKLNELVGGYYGRADLRGIPLSKADLSGANLSYIDFFFSDFSAANLSQSDLTGSWLSEANIKSTQFYGTKMDGVILDNVDFDEKTSFLGVNLVTLHFDITFFSLLRQQTIEQRLGLQTGYLLEPGLEAELEARP